MPSRTALLLHLEPEYRDALSDALEQRDYQVIMACLPTQRCPEQSPHTCIQLDTIELLEWIKTQAPDADCLITSSNLPIQVPPGKNVNYPPYDAYERIITRMNEQGYGRIVNLFYGPGSSQGLSMHQLQTIANRYDALFDHSDILFNSVNIGPVETNAPDEDERIFRERLETIIWLATTDNTSPDKQFFRGYEAS
jgi:hypothetical protein